MSAFISQIHIFADRHLRNQGQFLMDDDNAAFFGILDVGKLADLAVVDDIPFIRSVGVDPAENVHQGRFSRAVFSDQRMDFALFHLEIHVIKGFYTWEGLRDILHFQQDLSHCVLLPSTNDAGEHSPPASSFHFPGSPGAPGITSADRRYNSRSRAAALRSCSHPRTRARTGRREQR